MWTLVRKDLVLNRRVLGLNLAFYLILLPAMASLDGSAPPAHYAGFAATACSILPLTLVAREDKFRTTRLTCSLPVTRDAVVNARYWGGGALALAGTALILAAGYLVPQTGFAARGDVGTALLVALLLLGLVQAVLLPFTIRFGMAGLMVFLAATQVLGIAVFLAVALAGLNPLRAAIGAIAGTLGAVRAAVGPPGLAAILVAGVILLNLASAALSRRLFRAREL